MTEWLALRDNLKRWEEDWNAGLVLIRLSDGSTMYLDDAVPDTRGECPTQKPCPHIRCKAHLWRVDACDRAGRPGLSSVPRDARGLTLSVPGDAGTERAGTTIEARWLETPVPPSCAFDEIDALGRAMTNEEVGDRCNRHRTLAARDVRSAFDHAKENADRMFGMSEADLLRGLRELGAGR